jgi:hypothetical protein
MITAMDNIEFNYRTESWVKREYEEILNRELTSLECKHVVSLKNKNIYDASVNAGYEWVVFGSHRKGSLETEEKIILDMTKDAKFNRPIRIVYSKDERLWADNTHTTMAYINRYGENVCLKDVPFYLVDIRGVIPVIASIHNSVSNNFDDIYSAFACSERINDRLDKGVRPIDMSWTIKDLKEEFDFYCSIFNVMNKFIRCFYEEPIIERITKNALLYKDNDKIKSYLTKGDKHVYQASDYWLHIRSDFYFRAP